MAVGLALITALMWGVMEVLLLRVAKQAGAFTVALWLSVIGGLLALPIAIMSGPPDDRGQLALALVPGLLGVGATFLYLVALRVGKLTVVSPTVATSGGVGAVLAVVFLDERFQLVVALAVVASVVGVVLASASRRGGVTGAGWAVPAALLFGAYTTTLAVSAERVGPMWAVLGYRAATLLVLVPAGVVMGGLRLSLPHDVRAPIVAAALLETTGFAAFSVALGLGPVAIVSVVMAQFTTVAVVLAAVVLRERLRPHQWAGVAIVIGSVVALGTLR
jgi:drug/metabolite transporter (DMT)-like permease